MKHIALRIAEKIMRKALDRFWECCREHHCSSTSLASRHLRTFDYHSHLGLETHIKHSVRFVQNEKYYRPQRDYTESNQNPESNSPEAEAALAATSPTSPTAADEMRVSAALQSQGGMSIMSQSYDDDFEDEEDTTAS